MIQAKLHLKRQKIQVDYKEAKNKKKQLHVKY